MKHKILIVDDEPNIVVTLEFLMEQQDYEYVIARDGEEAMEKIREFKPELVLLDIMLPRLNGYEVCQRIRENADLKRIKIILLTAKGREVEIAKGMALGADAYITKPFATKDLIEEVRRQLGQDV